ncbi:hypothetical protein [Alistipes putredinis]|uniref:hypothetical protein n=1 Tax=Alistipes putredinis TaxID=28117 RepID=UPI003A8FFDD2
MADRKQIMIKERILRQAMELWGVSNVRDMDPVVDLLLEVFAYESNKLHQEIEQSDSRILHRLSRILIGNKWSLPKPAHALMTVTPNHGECCELDAEDHFYAEKNIFGKGDVQFFITPLFSHKLIDGKIRAIAYGDSIRLAADGFNMPTRFLNPKNRLADYCIWVGIDISKEVLQETDSVTFCIKPSDMSLLPFMKMASFHDAEGNQLYVKTGLQVEDPYRNAHYFNEIRDFYSDLYFNVRLSADAKTKHNCQQMFPGYISGNDTIDELGSLLWIKVVFPEIFTKAHFENLEVYLNTFPVVNRQLVYKQHNFRSTGRIIPLKCPSRTHFLNIRSFQDNKGREYVNRLNQYEENPTGIFSLYFGELERFDSDNARSLISKVLQLVKEDGNAFASMNPDALSTQLKELFGKITEIEKSLDSTLREENKIKAFVLSVPKKDASNAEIKYWATSGALANGFDERTLVQQFNIEKYDASGILLRTCMQGGMTHDSEQDLINSLRYGLLSRERIISKEDIKNYILHQLGRYVDSVEVGNGVAISPDSKKGLIRVTEVKIKLGQFNENEISNLPELAHYFERDLTERSVCNSNYKIVFI